LAEVVPARRTWAAETGVVLLFSATLFVSSSLLFTVQPMVGKMLLPLLGGTPAVWNTCMLFFQAALLAGYAYAHGSCRWLGVRRQAAMQVVVVLLPLLALPIAVAAGGGPPEDRTPIPWLLWQLTVAVGAPFAVVSTTAPLLQRWFAGTGHTQARDPYFLYAASNTGSLLALLAYPVVLEPALRLTQQTWAWVAVYALFVLLVSSCAVVVRRARPAAIEGESSSQAVTDTAAAPTLAWRLWWVFLASVPSSLMLGVTTYITTDVAAVPLLWVLPLALYLLSFVVVFARRPVVSPQTVGRWLPFLLLPLTFVMMLNWPHWRAAQIMFHLAAFLVAALTCHGRLAASRPPARYLTEYYFWMSVGGVLGGIFNVLAAPLIFPAVFEYPLAMALACFAVPGLVPSRADRPRAWLDFLLPLAGGVLWAAWIAVERIRPMLGIFLLLAVPTTACLLLRKRPVRLALGVLIVVAGQAYLAYFRPGTLCLERNFFGVKRVACSPGSEFRVLVHGGTIHGRQFTDPARSREPLTYYHRTGPAGDLFRALNDRRPQANVAVIGLGAGSVACYAQPEQHFTFYELDPAVARIAEDPRYFTFLRQCAAPYDIVLGDGRLTLARSPEGRYDLILLDAFSSDAIPTHLLTREALQLYLRKLAPGGWIAFHYTNAALEIGPVLANLAAEAGLTCLYRDDRTSGDGKTPAKYAALARNPADLADLAAAPGWQPLAPQPGAAVWTDQYSNLLGLMKWR
jgi:hypothetical protein